jgi:hypothetical protein
MAILHKATVIPAKTDLIAGWLPGRSWYPGSADPDVVRVASFRFDDPDGEVGIETLLVSANGEAALQIPLTYRSSALAGAEAHLLGTTEHSVLGTRWVYDALGDPVYLSALLTAVLTGGDQVAEYVHDGENVVHRAPTTFAHGSGTGSGPIPADSGAYRDGPTAAVDTAGYRIELARTVGAEPAGSGETLTASWAGQEPTVLVRVTPIA